MSTTVEQVAPGARLTTHVHTDVQINPETTYYIMLPNSAKFLHEIQNENFGFDPNRVTEERFSQIVAEQLASPDLYPDTLHLLLYMKNHDNLTDYGIISIPNFLLEKFTSYGIELCKFAINTDPNIEVIKVLDGEPDESEIYYNHGRVYETQTIILK